MADTATYITSDSGTQGSWKGYYGSQGFAIAGNVASSPLFVTVTPAGQSLVGWAGETDDVRALQRANDPGTESRCAYGWYGFNNSFTLNFSFSDANTHRVALYFLDWQRLGYWGQVEVRDSLGNLLDSQAVSAFQNGLWLVWDLSGSVTFHFLYGGPNNTTYTYIPLGGIFFDGAEVLAGEAVTELNAFVGVQVDNTQSLSGEHVIWSEWPPNVQQFTQMFVVVAMREAPPATLTLNKTLNPSGDPGKFNLLIDGHVRATDVGNGGTTGPVEVGAGVHTVAEEAGTDTVLSDYARSVEGVSVAGTVTIGEGEAKTVTFTNTRTHIEPPHEGGGEEENPPESNCPPAFTLRRVALTLRRAKLPVRGADK